MAAKRTKGDALQHCPKCGMGMIVVAGVWFGPRAEDPRVLAMRPYREADQANKDLGPQSKPLQFGTRRTSRKAEAQRRTLPNCKAAVSDRL